MSEGPTVADDRVHVVTIMNYPPDPRYRQMCHAFLDTAIRGGAAAVTILYEEHRPEVAAEHRRAVNVEIVQRRSHDVGHPHFNLRFKLPNLAALTEPFLYLDADTAVIGDLRQVWRVRTEKPWVGIDHQWVPADARTHRPPFLNSGVQLVGDPAFYDLAAILAAQNAVVPLARHAEVPKAQMFPCPGQDQAVLFRYFRGIGYDYTHPSVGPEWNSCAGVTQIRREAGGWAANTVGLAANYPVRLVHYWSQFKPWAIDCPLFASYSGAAGQTNGEGE